MGQETVSRRISIFIDAQQGADTLKKLEAQEARLQKSSAQLTEGTKAWVKEMGLLKNVQKDIAMVKDQLDGKLGPTVKQLKNEQKALNKELSQMPIELRNASQEAARLKQVENALASVKSKAQSTTAAFGSFKQMVVGSAMGMMGGNIITTLVGGATRMVSDSVTRAAQLSDQLADVRKTTGMTTKEVHELNDALAHMDTRTATSELRNMAIVAGQFGIPKEQILGFIKAVDKVNIALGDEFTGGAQQIAEEMSKLRNVFTDIKTADVGLDIQHIANALNVLGAAGVATGPVVADFANRIGGVGIQLGLSTAQVLGLSATLQELNVSTERGGTAVTKILQKMLTNTKDFAEVAGMNVKDFKNLLNRDLFGAFKAVMAGSAGAGKSSTALAGIIKDLELQGAGASEVFAKLGINIGLLDERVTQSSPALTNTASLTQEVAIKSDNLAGSIEKLEKKWAMFWRGSGSDSEGFFKFFVDGASSAIDAMGYLMRSLGMIAKIRDEFETRSTEIAEQTIKNEEAKREARYKYVAQAKQLGDEELAAEKKKQEAIRQVYLEAAQRQVAEHDRAGFIERKRLFNEANYAIQQIKLIEDARKQKSMDPGAEPEDKKLKKLQAEIRKLQEEAYLNSLSENERELKAVEIKYKNLLERARSYARETQQLRDLESTEILQVYDKQIKKAREKYDTDMVDWLKKEKEKTKSLEEETAKRIKNAYDMLLVTDQIREKFARSDQGRLDAEKKLNHDRAMARIESEKATAEEQQLIWAEVRAAELQLDRDFWMKKLANLGEIVSQMVSVQSAVNTLNDKLTAQRLAREEKVTQARLKDNDDAKQAELDRLEEDNKKGLMKTSTYEKSKTAIEKKYADKSAEISADLEQKKNAAARRSAQAAKDMAIFNAIISTAQAVVGQLAALPIGPWNIALAAAMGFSGAAQVALIEAEPLPEMAAGGRTVAVKGQQSGKQYNANYVGPISRGGRYSSASLGIVGEAGPELVIPNWLYAHPRMMNTMGALEHMITARQFAAGGITQTVEPFFASVSKTDDSVGMQMEMLTTLKVLNTHLAAGIHAKLSYDELTRTMGRIDSVQQDNA